MLPTLNHAGVASLGSPLKYHNGSEVLLDGLINSGLVQDNLRWGKKHRWWALGILSWSESSFISSPDLTVWSWFGYIYHSQTQIMEPTLAAYHLSSNLGSWTNVFNKYEEVRASTGRCIQTERPCPKLWQDIRPWLSPELTLHKLAFWQCKFQFIMYLWIYSLIDQFITHTCANEDVRWQL